MRAILRYTIVVLLLLYTAYSIGDIFYRLVFRRRRICWNLALSKKSDIWWTTIGITFCLLVIDAYLLHLHF